MEREQLASGFAIVVLAGVVLLGGASAPSAGVFPGKNGAIAFASSKRGTGPFAVWVSERGAGAARRLVRGGQPAWSPDGRRLAYVRNYEINLIGKDGSGRQSVASGTDLAWSPDGTQLVAIGDITPFVIDLVKGTHHELSELTDQGIGYFSYFHPAWSPDGKRIAFTADAGGGPQIALYDVASHTVRYLAVEGAHPSWSPDGKRLAFDTEGVLGQSRNMYVSRADGKSVRLLARNATEPAWSPDGRKIVFIRRVTRTNTELFVMNPDGSHQTRLTFRPGQDRFPDWQRVPT